MAGSLPRNADFLGARAGGCGEDKHPYLGPGERHVIIQIHPERVDGFGAGG
jgi:hypothetical protein